MIQRTDNGRWALPGGGHDIGESITDTVVRKVREEAGIEAQVIDLSGIYTDPGHVMLYDDGEARQPFSMCFRARPVGGQLRTSDETREVRWVTPADIASFDVHPTPRAGWPSNADLPTERGQDFRFLPGSDAVLGPPRMLHRHAAVAQPRPGVRDGFR